MRSTHAIGAALAALLIAAPFFAFAAPDIVFFYSPTCPHCTLEEAFLKELEKRDDALVIARYSVDEPATIPLLKGLLREHDAERYFGVVPLTFVGESFFVGFDSAKGIGAQIEAALQTPATTATSSIPFADIVPKGASLSILAVVLGFLDGFNVCSLGAVVLILGLALAVRRRAKIAVLGASFIIVTALLYGVLILVWYQVFQFLAPALKLLNFAVGALALGGGILFLRQFARYRKYGPTCGFGGRGIVHRFAGKVERAFSAEGESPSGKRGTLALAGIVAAFAAVVTIVEFPCSAAVPLAYAGILSSASLPVGAIIAHIALFVFFYLLDELVVFAVAVWKMNVWMASPKFTVWAALVEGIVLVSIGIYYLLGVI